MNEDLREFLRRWRPQPRWGVIAAPYLWLILFFAIPFLIVLKISFTRMAIAMPPYTPINEIVPPHRPMSMAE